MQSSANRRTFVSDYKYSGKNLCIGGRVYDTALWHSRCNTGNFRHRSFQDNLLSAILQEGGNPIAQYTTDTIKLQFLQKSLMWDFIKSLGEIEQDNVVLFSSINSFGQVLNCEEKLGFT